MRHPAPGQEFGDLESVQAVTHCEIPHAAHLTWTKSRIRANPPVHAGAGSIRASARSADGKGRALARASVADDGARDGAFRAVCGRPPPGEQRGSDARSLHARRACGAAQAACGARYSSVAPLRSASRSLVRESLSNPRMDLIFLGVIVAFFGVTWGLAVLGDRLSTVSARGAEERVR